MIKKKPSVFDVLKGKAAVLGDEKILDNWSILIDKGEGKAGQVYEKTKAYIQKTEVPNMEMNLIQVVPKSPIAKRAKWKEAREYLRVKHEILKDYNMYVGARDYGNNLDVQWYLTCEPGLLKKALSQAITKGTSDKAISLALDLFSQQDLRAYATVVHHSLLQAVVDIMDSLNQDTSEIDRKSKGFLGIS